MSLPPPRLRSFLLATLLVLSAANLLRAQETAQGQPQFGGSFDKLAPEQKQLVIKWHEEYEKITGNHLDPVTSYNNLRLSVRTTFEAVTHALLKTNLTDEQGKSIGNALSLVKLVETVHGEIPKTRGDQQFRIYVLLADDAVDKLYQSRQFKRTGDNTIFHIGYPVNFRQQGGSPSIQVSVTRTGLRADIDVDYRSSGGPQALVNGHLTAANSDVRAGNNYAHHVKRWENFGDWWRELFGFVNVIPKADWEALSSQYTKPRVRDSENVEVAVRDFYQAWIVEAKPQLALAYMSVKANACIEEFGSGESAKNSMVRLRVFEHMKNANRKLGKVNSLDEVLHGIVMVDQGAVPVDQPNGKIFAISQLPDDLARTLDCRKTLRLPLVEDLPRASHTLGHFYGISTILKAKDSQGPGQLLYQIWTREEKSWKIVSWYLENPFKLSSSPSLATADAKNVATPGNAPANAELSRATDSFLQDWLISRDFAKAAQSFAPESLQCAPLAFSSKKSSAPSGYEALLKKWLEEVADTVPRKDKLDAIIQTTDYDRSNVQPVPHSNSKWYALLKVSDDLARMSNCAFRNSGAAVQRAATSGTPTFTLNTYETIFQPKHHEGDRGAVVLTWSGRKGLWKITAFSVVTY
jgi:hypothetical protein